MRELPEPEGYFFREDSGYIGGGETIRTGDFTLEQVLAIQKQAYEDGLRDAGKDAERYRWLRQHQLLAKIHYMPTTPASYLDEAIDIAMLTASQKERQ